MMEKCACNRAGGHIYTGMILHLLCAQTPLGAWEQVKRLKEDILV